MKQEIETHRLIRISMKDNIMLFLSSIFGDRNSCCRSICGWKNDAKIQKLFQEGRLRIEKDLNVIKLIKSIKEMRILMKNSMMTPEIRFKVAHSTKNCINLDSEGSDHSEEDNFTFEDSEDEESCESNSISNAISSVSSLQNKGF